MLKSSLSSLSPPFFLSLQSGEGGVGSQGIGQGLGSLGKDFVPSKAVEEICFDIMRAGETLRWKDRGEKEKNLGKYLHLFIISQRCILAKRKEPRRRDD